MTFTEQLLAIILSVFLAIFLLLGIVVLTFAIKILKHVKAITQKAEKLADQAEHVGDFFAKTGGTAAIAKFVSNIVNVMREHGKKGGKE